MPNTNTTLVSTAIDPNINTNTHRFSLIKHDDNDQIIDLNNFRMSVLEAVNGVINSLPHPRVVPYAEALQARLQKIFDVLACHQQKDPTVPLWDDLSKAIDETKDDWFGDWSFFGKARPLVFAVSEQLKLHPRIRLLQFDLEREHVAEVKALKRRTADLEDDLNTSYRNNTNSNQKILRLESENEALKAELKDAKDALTKSPDDYAAEHYTSHQAEITRLLEIIDSLEFRLAKMVAINEEAMSTYENIKLESENTKGQFSFLIQYLKANGAPNIEAELKAWQANTASKPNESASASEAVKPSSATPANAAPPKPEENVSQETFKKYPFKKISSVSVDINPFKDRFFSAVPDSFEAKESIPMTEKLSKQEDVQHAGSINSDGSPETKKKGWLPSFGR